MLVSMNMHPDIAKPAQTQVGQATQKQVARTAQTQKHSNGAPLRLAIIGGGAAGFFLALNAHELHQRLSQEAARQQLQQQHPQRKQRSACPQHPYPRPLEIHIFEKSARVMSKLALTGHGRCNCTNTFAKVKRLDEVYPRGSRLLKKLFKQFGPRDTYQWFEEHGVALMTQDDQRIFPSAQTSQTILDMFLEHAHKYRVQLHLKQRIDSPENLLIQNGGSFDFVAVTTGGASTAVTTGGSPTSSVADTVSACVPSLFGFCIADPQLCALAGSSRQEARLSIPHTSFCAKGPLLITHQGVSGPAALSLSSYAARWLAEKGYQHELCINWTGARNQDEIRQQLADLLQKNPHKRLANVQPHQLSQRLWNYLIEKNDPALRKKHCSEVSKKQLNKLVLTLANDTYEVSGRSAHKEEFVTCGGVSLRSVNSATLESKRQADLYYAGEVLDIDGITGGFNLQAAWTCAWVVAHAITCIATQVD